MSKVTFPNSSDTYSVSILEQDRKSNFGSRARQSNLVSFKLEDIQLQVENNEVADVTVNLDYIDGLNPRRLKNVVSIANKIEDYLTNYPNNPNDFFEVINRNLTEELLSDSKLKLSKVLDSLSVNLDVSPKIIPFPFDNTNTRTPDGDLNDIVSFELKDIQLDVTNKENADVTITLDYINGIDPSGFKEVGAIADRVEDYLTNYPNNPNDFFEVINRNLTEELLSDPNLGLSEVLDSLSVNLDVAPSIIPFQFDSTTTRTPNGDLNDVVSFQLEDVTSPIDGGIVTDISVNLDYADGIDPSGFKEIGLISNYIEDFLANYPVEAGFYEVLSSDSTIADLHYIIQIVMGWKEEHLHQFLIHGVHYGISYLGTGGFIHNAHEVKLSQFGFREREKFSYEYDFFSSWKHQIRVEAILPDESDRVLPICTAGKGSCPPENCGGVVGFITLRQQHSRFKLAARIAEILTSEGIEKIGNHLEELYVCQWL